MSFVERAWLVDARPPERPEESTLFVCIAVEPPHGERAARATITAIQKRCAAEDLPLTVMASEPGKPLEISAYGLDIYQRAASEPKPEA